MEDPPDALRNSENNDVPRGPWPDIARQRLNEELLSELGYKGRKFIFNGKLPVRVTQKEGWWTLESDTCKLMGYGSSRSEAELSFCFDFSSCWDDLACEEDENLTYEAINMKRQLLNLVKSVE